MVGSKEFSAGSDFSDPSISYLMPDVMCTFCNDCRDVDLLRDPSLAEHDWGCPKCTQPLNKAIIENRLIDLTKKRLVAYQTQDLLCSKCGLVKSSNTQLICPTCSGNFVCKESPEKCKKGYVWFTCLFFFFFWFLKACHSSHYRQIPPIWIPQGNCWVLPPI